MTVLRVLGGSGAATRLLVAAALHSGSAIVATPGAAQAPEPCIRNAKEYIATVAVLVGLYEAEKFAARQVRTTDPLKQLLGDVVRTVGAGPLDDLRRSCPQTLRRLIAVEEPSFQLLEESAAYRLVGASDDGRQLLRKARERTFRDWLLENHPW